jgi:hypothetical protein
MTEENAARLREAEARRLEQEHEAWVMWGHKAKWHFYMEGEPLCKTTEPKQGFRHIHKREAGALSNRGPVKILCCPDCLRLNAKRKRDEKKLEKLAAD